MKSGGKPTVSSEKSGIPPPEEGIYYSERDVTIQKKKMSKELGR